MTHKRAAFLYAALLYYVGLVNKERVLLVTDKGVKVDYPRNNVSNSGEGHKKTYNESNDVFGLKVSYNSVDTACYYAGDNLNENSDPKRKCVILFS